MDVPFPINVFGVDEFIIVGFVGIFTGFIDKFVGDDDESSFDSAMELTAGELTTIRGGGVTGLPLVRTFVDRFVVYVVTMKF